VPLAALDVRQAPAASWRPPVAGGVTRGFDLGSNPFEGGRHRGLDLAAPPGTAVRAACGGRVVVAGRVGTNGGVVTVRCGRWRVSHMPLAAITVRRGSVIRRGDLVGRAARSPEHRGLHLGVRREGVRFGYVDPRRFLGRDYDPPVIGGRRSRPRTRVRPPRLGPAPRPATRAPAVMRERVPAGLDPARPASSSTRAARGPAPWPVWAGLALFLTGVGMRRRGGRPRGHRTGRPAESEMTDAMRPSTPQPISDRRTPSPASGVVRSCVKAIRLLAINR
jgi:hypothetical protein